MNVNESAPDWAAVCIKLLQGPLYRINANDKYWNLLIAYESNIQSYFSIMNVFVLIDKSDGYAYLSQKEESENEDQSSDLPKLIKRIPLTPEVSFICVLLREALDSFDSSQSDSSILVMSANEIKDLLSVYIKEQSDQTKFIAKLDSYLSQLVSLSFLKELIPDNGAPVSSLDRTFEVRRIIRAKINAEFLELYKKKLVESSTSEEEK